MLNITFLGTDCWIPEADNDASGFLVNGKYLIDTGYFLQNSLTKLGIKTHEIEHLFFTHMHHDHYMALPQLIFFYLQKGRPLEELHMYGPKRDLSRVVKLAMRFLQKDADMEFYRGTGYPTLHELDGGETITFEDVIIETCPSFHAVDGICSKRRYKQVCRHPRRLTRPRAHAHDHKRCGDDQNHRMCDDIGCVHHNLTGTYRRRRKQKRQHSAQHTQIEQDIQRPCTRAKR